MTGAGKSANHNDPAELRYLRSVSFPVPAAYCSITPHSTGFASPDPELSAGPTGSSLESRAGLSTWNSTFDFHDVDRKAPAYES
ncbi:uncharacterized protein Dmul_23410 [Desulfococcus multivorans]|nr:uncharacterized protein Dmul_23410 [Desulfococcus multivorans]